MKRVALVSVAVILSIIGAAGARVSHGAVVEKIPGAALKNNRAVLRGVPLAPNAHLGREENTALWDGDRPSRTYTTRRFYWFPGVMPPPDQTAAFYASKLASLGWRQTQRTADGCDAYYERGGQEIQVLTCDSYLELWAFTTLRAPASPKKRTIGVWAFDGRLVIRDGGTIGPSNGDTRTGTDILRNQVAQFGKPANAVIGSTSYVVTFVDPPVVTIKATVKLPGGSLRLEGGGSLLTGSLVTTKETVTLDIVGGTGRFKGARGTGEFRGAMAGNPAPNVYRIQLP